MCLTSWLCSMRKRPSMPRKVSRAGAWVVGFTLTALALNGCASIGVKPWERDLMAQKAMAVDSHPLQSAMDEHIYFSKEASSGGRGFAGGGCGCN